MPRANKTQQDAAADSLTPRGPDDPVEAAATAEVPAEAPKPDGVRVMILCDHVYLPVDLLSPAWAQADTQRYDGEVNDRRHKITVHPSLADFLQKRKQAEILD